MTADINRDRQEKRVNSFPNHVSLPTDDRSERISVLSCPSNPRRDCTAFSSTRRWYRSGMVATTCISWMMSFRSSSDSINLGRENKTASLQGKRLTISTEEQTTTQPRWKDNLSKCLQQTNQEVHSSKHHTVTQFPWEIDFLITKINLGFRFHYRVPLTLAVTSCLLKVPEAFCSIKWSAHQSCGLATTTPWCGN